LDKSTLTQFSTLASTVNIPPLKRE
jgi:hypothetical protein